MFAALSQPVPEILQRGGGGGARGAQQAGGRSGGQGGFGGDVSDAERQQLREQVQTMSPEQRAEFFAARGGGRGGGGRGGRGSDGFGGQGGRAGGGGAQRRRANQTGGAAVPTVERGATTIDALFAPLEATETDGRLWVLDGEQLRPVDVRLGVTDGTATELLGIRGARRPARPEPDSQIAELRQQIAAVEDLEARTNLEQLMERLEADGEGAMPGASVPAAATLNEGTALVTGVTTPEGGSSAGSPSGGSPLIPQFGRGRGRR